VVDHIEDNSHIKRNSNKSNKALLSIHNQEIKTCSDISGNQNGDKKGNPHIIKTETIEISLSKNASKKNTFDLESQIEINTKNIKLVENTKVLSPGRKLAFSPSQKSNIAAIKPQNKGLNIIPLKSLNSSREPATTNIFSIDKKYSPKFRDTKINNFNLSPTNNIGKLIPISTKNNTINKNLTTFDTNKFSNKIYNNIVNSTFTRKSPSPKHLVSLNNKSPDIRK
jgi:hypothetical protein